MLYLSAWPEHDSHITGTSHPERPVRVGAALKGLSDAGLEEAIVRLAPRAATRDELALVHKPAYLDWLEAACQAGGGQLDPDTAVSPGSWGTALLAAGGVLAVVESMEEAGDGVGFAVHRPPGHHATADQAMGFCLLNNVAVAAATLMERGQRVLVVDWDVHHGNGTESIFWDDPRALYVSTHQSPLYPGTGAAADVGGPHALGLNINVPVPPGATGDVLAYAFDELVAPAVERFSPDWALVSCGFDAHRSDPLAQLALSAADFAGLATRAASWVGPGRTVVVLEGGYDLDALSASTGAVFSALLGGRFRPEGPTSGGPGRQAVDHAREVRLRSVPGW